MSGTARDMYGSYSSYGDGGCCCCDGGCGGSSLSLPILIAALAAATLFLLNAILGVGRRRRRQAKNEEEEGVVRYVSDLVWNGETLHTFTIVYTGIIKKSFIFMVLSLGIEDIQYKIENLESTAPGLMFW